MRSNNKPRKNRKWLIYIGAAVAVWAGLAFMFDFFPNEEQDLRRKFRNAVENTFPQQAAKVAKSFGLISHGEESEQSLKINPAASSVVLVHGLDAHIVHELQP